MTQTVKSEKLTTTIKTKITTTLMTTTKREKNE